MIVYEGLFIEICMGWAIMQSVVLGGVDHQDFGEANVQ
jgi:hypothetical protein